jgi:hypothetical protein
LNQSAERRHGGVLRAVHRGEHRHDWPGPTAGDVHDGHR